MQILDARVYWSFGYANNQTLEIMVDALPSRQDLRYRSKVIGNGYTLYWASTADGFVNFMAHNPSNENGYGGSVFTLTMEDGSIIKVKGPWSGSGDYMREHGFPASIDVMMAEYRDGTNNQGPDGSWVCSFGGYITAEIAKEAVAKYMTNMELVQGRHALVPALKGETIERSKEIMTELVGWPKGKFQTSYVVVPAIRK